MLRLSPAIAIVLLTAGTNVVAQQVFRCTGPGGKTIYSDRACPSDTRARVVNANPNTLDRTEGRDQEARDAWRREREREYWAQEHERQSAQARQAQQVATDKRLEQDRKTAFREATNVLPGAHGLTRNQRERAVELAATPAERAEVMREAATPLRGARGLTASQLDATSRLSAVNQGRALPPAARPTPAALPQPAAEGPEAPAAVVNCDQAGCWDTSGRRLNNAAGGNFHRSDGKFCTPAGPNVICN